MHKLRRKNINKIPKSGPISPTTLPHSPSETINSMDPVSNFEPTFVPIPKPTPKNGLWSAVDIASISPPKNLLPITPFAKPPSTSFAFVKRSVKASTPVERNEIEDKKIKNKIITSIYFMIL